MPGVEILNTTIHYKEVLPTWAIIVMVAILIIPAVATLISLIVHNDILFTIGSTSLIRQTTNEIEYIEHEVLVDDSVSLTEFTKKYEKKKKKGKIYVVREKEND